MVDDILRRVKDALLNGEQSDQDERQPRPASEDPYGDPANQVADAGQFGDVRPASEDPYGDPADEQQNSY
jgi:hypothetical protein